MFPLYILASMSSKRSTSHPAGHVFRFLDRLRSHMQKGNQKTRFIWSVSGCWDRITWGYHIGFFSHFGFVFSLLTMCTLCIGLMCLFMVTRTDFSPNTIRIFSWSHLCEYYVQRERNLLLKKEEPLKNIPKCSLGKTKLGRTTELRVPVFKCSQWPQ